MDDAADRRGRRRGTLAAGLALLAAIAWPGERASAQQAQYPWSLSHYYTIPASPDQPRELVPLTIPGCVTTMGADVGPNVAVYCGTHGTPVSSGATGSAGASSTPTPTGPLGVMGAQSGGVTSASPNTFTLILAASPQRHGCVVQNTSSGVEYFFVGSNTPLIGTAIQVAPSGTYDCAHSNVVDQGDVRIASASPSAPFVMIAQ